MLPGEIKLEPAQTVACTGRIQRYGRRDHGWDFNAQGWHWSRCRRWLAGRLKPLDQLQLALMLQFIAGLHPAAPQQSGGDGCTAAQQAQAPQHKPPAPLAPRRGCCCCDFSCRSHGWFNSRNRCCALSWSHHCEHAIHNFFGAQLPIGQVAAMPLMQFGQGRAGQ